WVLWLHLFNVHEPYLPDGENSEFGKRAVDKYDTEIRLADREVGRLLKALATRGLDKDTVVILFSDHGEAFGEHGHTGHSTTLYEEEIRSTLLVRAPGFTPKTVTETVALYDLAPTLLNLADRPMPEPTAARSLIPVMLAGDATGVDGAGGADRQFISELLPDGMFPFDQKAIRVGDDKLIWWVRDGLVQLFDLATDPVEKHDLSDANPAKAKEILGDLRNWVAQSARNDLRHGMVVAKHRLKAPPKTVKYPLDVNYGAFTILGYDMPKREFRRGDRISMTFYYRVEEETRKNYFFSLDLVGPGNYRVHDFHAYHYPVNGHYPTTQWKTGEIIEDPVEIIVPDTVRVPVTMEVNLSVLHRRQRTPFHPDPKGLGVLPLGEIRIR
ncbi:MAG: sulfatase-like hydrolase/transferase, partial [Myxococcales bacterium]|nr:sulfatase-like hydrolase/transferase [Myxococcales bacterium]